VVCLIAIFSLPYVPRAVDGPGLALMMVSFMAPALFGLLIFVWWIAGSRASKREKWIGALAVALFAAVGMGLLHTTLRGMGAVIHVIPAAAAAFGLPLVLLAGSPRFRLPIALICLAATLGYWDLLRSHGVTGQFVSQLDWRWRPSPEETYLKRLAVARSQADQSVPTADVPISLGSAEWSAFRGPLRNGKQPGIHLNEDWTTSAPKQLWRVPVGPGWSSFSVAGDRLFTQEQRGENEAVVCLQASTGKTIWAHEYPSRFEEAVGGAGPRATPTLDDTGVFALGGNGILMRLDPSDGHEVWKKDLREDAGRAPPTWGFAASPLVVDGKVIVHAGGDGDKGVFAYDIGTGNIVWTAASGDHSYSSPQLATFYEVTGVLMVTNLGLQYLDATTGEELWHYEWPIENYRALQPLVTGNTILLAATLGDGTRSLNVTSNGSEWTVAENWSSRDLKPDFNDFVEHRGYLYGFDANIFTCVDLATGKRQWKKGRYGNGQVLLLPDGDQLLVSSESGDLVLLRTNPDRLEELAKFPAVEGKTWNHPVVVGNRVYLRNGQEAACFELATR
jgi:outer membrane protein assembly factor BamB